MVEYESLCNDSHLPVDFEEKLVPLNHIFTGHILNLCKTFNFSSACAILSINLSTSSTC